MNVKSGNTQNVEPPKLAIAHTTTTGTSHTKALNTDTPCRRHSKKGGEKTPKQTGPKVEYVETALSGLWRKARSLLTAAIRMEEKGEHEAAQGFVRMASVALVAPSE